MIVIFPTVDENSSSCQQRVTEVLPEANTPGIMNFKTHCSSLFFFISSIFFLIFQIQFSTLVNWQKDFG